MVRLVVQLIWEISSDGNTFDFPKDPRVVEADNDEEKRRASKVDETAMGAASATNMAASSKTGPATSRGTKRPAPREPDEWPIPRIREGPNKGHVCILLITTQTRTPTSSRASRSLPTSMLTSRRSTGHVCAMLLRLRTARYHARIAKRTVLQRRRM